MKKSGVLFLLLIVLPMVLWARTAWTVQTVPNTRLQSNDIHVSDPDGYLSDSAEMNINTALCAIRDQADVFVVTLASIGKADPKHFATELFNHWGIGDAETNNGVLLLFVEDQHALEFETGYGAETTLTDAQCERIFTKTIVPFFKAGDYEGGLCAGVADIVTVYGGEIPAGLKTILPEPDGGSTSDMSNFFLFFGLMVMTMPIVGIVYWWKRRHDKHLTEAESYRAVNESGITYLDNIKTSWSGSPWEGRGCLGGLTLGFSILLIFFGVYIFFSTKYPDAPDRWRQNWMAVISLAVYFTWICFRQNHRALKKADQLAKTTIRPKEIYNAAFQHTANKVAMGLAPWIGVVYYDIFKRRMAQCEECQCPKCNAAMSKDKSFTLPIIHALENRLDALKFEPYRCSNGHVYVMKEKGNHYSQYVTCKKCGGFTAKMGNSETIKKASYSEKGEKMVTYVCQNCGDQFTQKTEVPMLVKYSSGSGSYYSGSSSGRSYSGGSSHSSGGSFGGGHSGGGGYSGRW